MQARTTLSIYKKQSITILVTLILMLILYFIGGAFQRLGIPVGIILIIIFVYYRLIKIPVLKKDTSKKPHLEPPIIHQVKKTVEENVAGIDISVIGTEYRRSKHQEFEKNIDGILDNCIKLLHSHIDSHTTAIFFPTNDGGYKIRHYLSKSEFVNQDAVIYPGVGVIGAFLKTD